jgi:glutathione S-transferase
VQIAEAVNDTLSLVLQLPFIRKRCADAGSNEELVHHEKLAKVKWLKMGTRLDTVIKANGGVYLVGSSLSYADILVAHMTTWFVEEVGADLLQSYIKCSNMSAD